MTGLASSPLTWVITGYTNIAWNLFLYIYSIRNTSGSNTTWIRMTWEFATWFNLIVWGIFIYFLHTAAAKFDSVL